MTRPLLLLALLALSSPAAAQSSGLQPREENLYLNPAMLIGSTRIVSLGGAYVAIGEGTSSFTSNLAALAHRSPTLERSWDVGVTLSLLDFPIGTAEARDFDNDGVADQNQATLQLLAGLMLQVRNFGLGAYVRGNTTTVCAAEPCRPEDQLDVVTSTSALAGAVAINRDQLILAFGLYSASATFTHGGEERRYGNTGISLDLLYRPELKPYRIGISVRPQVLAVYQPGEGQLPFLASRQLLQAVASPAVLSLGVALKFGHGREHFNRLSPIARAEVIEAEGIDHAPPELPSSAPMGSLLVSAQLDLLSPVENAVPMTVFTLNRPFERVGNATYLVPRLGAEHETLPGRLRLRAGTYIEPSPFVDKNPRPHLTGGAEVFVLRYWQDWALSVAGDVAYRYYNLGFSLGFWR